MCHKVSTIQTHLVFHIDVDLNYHRVSNQSVFLVNHSFLNLSFGNEGIFEIIDYRFIEKTNLISLVCSQGISTFFFVGGMSKIPISSLCLPSALSLYSRNKHLIEYLITFKLRKKFFCSLFIGTSDINFFKLRMGLIWIFNYLILKYI